MIASPFFWEYKTPLISKMTLSKDGKRIFDSSDRENILFVSNPMLVDSQLENIY